MSKTLIIAEKPSVAADIAKVLGAPKKGESAYESDDEIISWAIGHLLELLPPEGYDDKLKRWRLSDLPIMPKAFKLNPLKGTTRQLNFLKKQIKRKDVGLVINACDAGREGELIFREIYRYSGSDKPVRRLWLQSMTSDAIRESLNTTRSPTEVQGLADAADCRAESDWLIGMNATRALTVRLRSSRDRVVWSAGRVQTATLALLVRREREILDHEPQPYWVIQASFSVPGQDASAYDASWYNPKAEGPKDRIFDTAERDRILALLEASATARATEARKDSREAAPPLFDLTSLQREANRRFGFTARRTLSAAQALYEGHKLITYPRTDSRALPSDYVPQVNEALTFLSADKRFAPHAHRLQEQGLANTERNFNDAAVSDHFAIIPTGSGNPEGLRADEERIFDLVVRRFLAAFHPQAVFTEVERLTHLGDDLFRTRRKVLKVAGWRACWDRTVKADDASSSLPALPDAGPEGATVDRGEYAPTEKETRPPARLTEASLLGLMETAGRQVDDDHLAQVLKDTGGLGTPATRGEIIETLVRRQYSGRCASLEGRKALRATARGIRLVDALERIGLPRMTSPALTADLEDSLKAVERGSRQRKEYMEEVRTWTTEIVDKVRGFSFDTLYADTEPLGTCPLSGHKLVENLRTYSVPGSREMDEPTVVIWKEVGGRYIDRKSARQLLDKKETPAKAGFFTRDEREYEASLHLAEDGRVEVRSRAGGQAAAVAGTAHVEPADVGPCPFHPDQLVRRTNRGYRCDLVAEKKCKLDLPLEVCKRPLTLEEVQGLIGEERKTELLDSFTSKRNRPFSATLHLQDTGRIRFEFPPRGARGGNQRKAKEFPVVEGPLAPVPKLSQCAGSGSGNIIETATDYVSDQDDCAISVPREICKRELTREEAKLLFENKETPVLDGFISKAGKPFSAQLYLKRTGRHGFRFANRD